MPRNKLAFCQTKLLENLEDLIVEIHGCRSSNENSIKNNVLNFLDLFRINEEIKPLDTTNQMKMKYRNKINNGYIKLFSHTESNDENNFLRLEKKNEEKDSLIWSKLNKVMIEFIQVMLEGHMIRI